MDNVGTIRQDRKALMKGVLSKKLKTGAKVTAYNLNYGTMCIQWKDKKDVCTITSGVPDEDIVVKRYGKDKMLPLVVNTYNDSMGGIN